MVTVEGVVKVDRARLTIFATRLDREISSTHGSLSHVINTVEEVGLVIVGLGEIR